MSDKIKLKSMQWNENTLVLLDQRKIPFSREYIVCKTLDDVIDSIKKMVVRGAPAIALAGMYGISLYLINLKQKPTYIDLKSQLEKLLQSRPTAVNLKLAIERYISLVSEDIFNSNSLDYIVKETILYSDTIFKEDYSTNKNIAINGALIFEKYDKKLSILTHCNTGALATAGIGTAIGIFRELRDKGYNLTIYASETRPYHQGSRLTAWELKEEAIECFIIADSMSAWLMNDRKIDAVIVGADRITSRGDTANKIGTFSHSIIAKQFSVPFYIAASSTSFDFNIKYGSEIHIEMRSEDELTQNSFLKDENGKNYIPEGVLAPIGAKALNPSFDVTPAENLTGIITEKGIISPVNEENIKKVLDIPY
jgi:methylthioribose-1-phosphate isomerase